MKKISFINLYLTVGMLKLRRLLRHNLSTKGKSSLLKTK